MTKKLFLLPLLIIPTFLYTQINHWETVVYNTDIWSYFIGNTEPPSTWFKQDFNDDSWDTGQGGIGYGDGDDNTIIPKTQALYIRHRFTIIDKEVIETMIFQADYDDGYIAYLNGVEIARANITGITPRYDVNTTTDHEATLYESNTVESVFLAEEVVNEILQEGENVLAIQVHNRNGLSSSDMTSNFFLTVGITTDELFYKETPDWFSAPNIITPLPIIKITTSTNINEAARVRGQLEIIHHTDKPNNSNDVANEYSGPISIKHRGQSSLWFAKKNFSFETLDEEGMDRDTSFLNFPAEEDWILHGPYSDKSLLRNVLTMELARRMGQYASRTQYCELFINEDYRGIYVLMEQIKRDKDRVDIAKLRETDITGDELTGGYIYKIDKGGFDWISNYGVINDPNTRLRYQLVYPDIDRVVPAQFEYIKSHVDSFETAMQRPSLSYGGKTFEEYIDLSSFAEAHLLNELGRNVDGYRLSSYFHKKKDSNGGKIHAGPVWDFNLAFRNADYCDGVDTEGLIFDRLCDGSFPFWWDTLLKNKQFNEVVKCRWDELRAGPFHQDSIYAFIDEQVAILEPAIDRNFQKWQILGTYLWPNPNPLANTHQQEIQILKEWIRRRLLWMDEGLAGTCQTVSIKEQPESVPFTLTPNPATNFINIRFSDTIPLSKGRLYLTNSIGQRMLQLPIEPDMRIPIAAYPSGFYMITLEIEGQVISEKFMVL